MKTKLNLLNNFDKYIAVVTLSATVILLALQVISRYVFNFSIAWAEEVSRFSYIWAVYMGMSMAARDNQHIRINVHLKFLLPPKIFKFSEAIADSIMVFFFVLMVFFSLKMLSFMYEYPFSSAVTKIPMYYVYTIIPLASFAIIARIIQRYLIKSGYPVHSTDHNI